MIEASLKAYDEDIQSKKETIEQTKKSIARIQKLIEKHPSQTTTATNSLQDLKNDIDRLTH
jgi:archaellum component FlaC